MRGPRVLALLCASASLALTLLAWLVPDVDLAYGSNSTHIALDAVGAAVGVIVGALAAGRFLRSGLFSDLAIALSLGLLLFVGSALLGMLPMLLSFSEQVPTAVWGTVPVTVASALLLASGGVSRRLVIVHRRRALGAGLALSILFLAATGTLVNRYESHLHLPIDPGRPPVTTPRPWFAGSATLLVLQAVTGVLLLAATLGFLATARAAYGPLQRWLGPVLVLGAVAAFNYALFPSVYSNWVYVGDLTLFAFYVGLLLVSIAEVREYARRVIDAAVLDERRRLARDLHDGVAQELAFLASGLRRLPVNVDPTLPSLLSAAERGLHESRRAIVALGDATPERDLGSMLLDECAEVAERAGAHIVVDVEPGVAPAQALRESMLRIAREATTNAVRHGMAAHVLVSVSGGDPILLRVVDDGTGFDAGTAKHGYGLTVMRERAEATDGLLSVDSAGGGTTITARWPRPARRQGRGGRGG